MTSKSERSDFGVLVVAYNRPKQLAQLLNSLSNGQFLESNIGIIVSIDGPKDKSSVNVEKHLAVLDVAKCYRKRNVVTDIVFQETNLGTAKNMVQSISYAFQFYNYVLVIEDDLVLSVDIKNISQIARRYINKQSSALSIYANLSKNKKPFLSRRFNSQGWITHKDYWNGFDLDYFRSYILNECQKNKIHRLLGSDIIRDFSLFQKQKIDTWAVPWNIFNFLNDRNMIYPNKSYIINNSHLIGAERTHNIEYPYQLAEVKFYDLDFENLKLDPNYVRHYSTYNRLRRRVGTYVQKYL